MPRLTKSKPVISWGLQWRSCNKLDGERNWIVMRHLVPALFKTRREARVFQQEQYGYMGKSSWAVPAVVRIESRVIDYPGRERR